MHILLTGGTGLIGVELCARWQAQGHRLTVWSRHPEHVSKLCGAQVKGIAQLTELGAEPVDAVINLAGAPVADRPWTRKRKALIWQSRIGLTEQLLAWIASREVRPKVLISGSAIGFYGDGGEREISETSPVIKEDFAARLCSAWEDSAQGAADLGLRVVTIRTGLVLAKHGSFLQRLLFPFKMGLGGPMGSGRQWMPWVHLKDEVAAIDFLLHDESAQGPYNLCAPNPVRNSEFAKTLGQTLHRPTFLAIPGFALRLGLGELSVMLLGGQRAQPSRLLSAGFRFTYPDLPSAFADVLNVPADRAKP